MKVILKVKALKLNLNIRSRLCKQIRTYGILNQMMILNLKLKKTKKKPKGKRRSPMKKVITNTITIVRNINLKPLMMQDNNYNPIKNRRNKNPHPNLNPRTMNIKLHHNPLLKKKSNL